VIGGFDIIPQGEEDEEMVRRLDVYLVMSPVLENVSEVAALSV